MVKTSYTQFMNEALEYARQAASQQEVPIGAVVVDAQGNIIGRGYNQVEGRKSQLAHAEIEAITQATQAIGDWRLDGCTLYVTLEPCKMCMGLIQLSRLDRVVYGADSPRFGHSDQHPTIYKEVLVEKGVRADEAKQLLQDFFKKRRTGI
jgi:tRNA(adenine34) deaminase